MTPRRAVAILLLTGLAAALLWPLPWLVISETAPDGSEARRWVLPGADGTRFALRWRHSVEREDWIETFVLHQGAVRVVESRFKTFGAGVPDGAGVRSRLEGGWVVMEDLDRRVDPLRVQAAAGSHYRLIYRQRCLDLRTLGRAPVLHFQQAHLPLAVAAGGLGRALRQLFQSVPHPPVTGQETP